MHGACCLACVCRDAHRHAGAGGTCRLQDTAFDSGVQVVLARRFADIKCPAEYSVEAATGGQGRNIQRLSLSPCGALCLFTQKTGYVTGLDTEIFSPAFRFKASIEMCGAPAAISRCKTRCYLARKEGVHVVALPGGEVLRKVDGPSFQVFACGGVVVSKGMDSVSVYDEDLTLLRFLSHKGCRCGSVAVSDCGGWVITCSRTEQDARLWDVNTGEAVACVLANRSAALSRCASVFAVVHSKKVQLYDWSGAALGNLKSADYRVANLQFTPSGKYLVVRVMDTGANEIFLHQYDVTTMSCVRVIPDSDDCGTFAISPCSRVVLFANEGRDTIVTRHLYPY